MYEVKTERKGCVNGWTLQRAEPCSGQASCWTSRDVLAQTGLRVIPTPADLVYLDLGQTYP